MSLLSDNKPHGFFWSSYWKISKFLLAASNKIYNVLLHCFLQQETPPSDMTPITRRSGNYNSSLWDYDYVQSLSVQYSGEIYLERVSELKAQLVIMLEGATEPVTQLEFIDDLQRLGISYHFGEIINRILTTIHDQKYLKNSVPRERDLYAEALKFRLLRQYGFEVSQEIFDQFKNEKDEFKSSLSKDTKGLLQLYEASHLLIEGETTLELAKEFATMFLQEYLANHVHELDDQNVKSLVQSALELPLHWRIQRQNARWFIPAYEKRLDMNPVVLELAKLDFNIVQATHQEELKHVSRWWKRTHLAEKLSFARDRPVECYFATLGGLFEPQYGHFRIMIAKVYVFITIIDDIYDVYGTLHELKLFTDAIERWDIEKLDQVPDCMQVCLLALNNFINEIAYDILKDQGFNIIPYLRKSWTDLCRAYLQEAMWYFQGYTPKTKEYINNAWISVSAPVILCHAYFGVANPIEKGNVQSLYKYHDIIHCVGMILRLVDDLGTSQDEMKRGDVPKIIECYMKETGATEKVAREYAVFLIRETWKKMNKELLLQLPFPSNFIRFSVDLCKFMHCMYQHGDGHGVQNSHIKERISSVIFEPIV